MHGSKAEYARLASHDNGLILEGSDQEDEEEDQERPQDQVDELEAKVAPILGLWSERRYGTDSFLQG